MLKYLMKLRHRKGFTLVELIIVIAILAALVACMMAFTGPIEQMVQQTAASSDALNANKIMGDYIENRLAFADKVNVLYAVDSTVTTTDITNAFDAMKSKANASSNPSAGKAGVMIFRFEEDTVDPTNSKYVIYDFVYSSTAASYAAVALDTGKLKDSGKIFADIFYDNSENLIIAPTTVSTNKVRNSVFMTVDILSYDFDEDYMKYNDDGSVNTADSIYINENTLSSYYAYKKNRETNPTGYPDETCGLGRLDIQKSGAKESISFEMQNMHIQSWNIQPGADGVLGTNDDLTLANCEWSAINPAGGSGTDIMIFYHVPKY